MAEGFINPYTFVQFPGLGKQSSSNALRSAPAGHARLKDERYMGRIDVEFSAQSPVLVRDRTGRFPRRRRASGEDAEPAVPNSGLKGAVRSLHETLSGGCARIFDQEFLPVYRDAAGPRSDDWTLALVKESDLDGRPVVLQLCSTVERRTASELLDHLGSADEVVTGARMSLPKRSRGGNQSGDGKWVLLVTDSAVWQEKRANDPRSPEYTCAVGKLSNKELRWSNEREWDTSWSEAWTEYLRRVDGTNDMRLARQDPEKRVLQPRSPVCVPVEFDGRTVGWRHAARRALFEGQVVWVRPTADGRGVAEFALSVIWRHSGSRKAGDRIPEAFLPCARPDELCPSCRMFGSVDSRGQEGHRQEAVQDGYAGHVRFSEALPTDSVELESWQLPPMGTPHPGAGEFYLNTGKMAGNEADGSGQEWREGDGRNLRGRKYYWLTREHERRPLSRLAGDLTSELATRAEALPAGTRLSATVWFENLTEAELGGLLAALNPALVLGNSGEGAPIGTALGGARPLGFGSCTSDITGLRVDTAASRYLRQPGPAVTVDGAVRAFRASVPSAVRKRWEQLAKVLTLDRVAPDHVWYPTDQPLPSGPLEPEDLEQDGFTFWKNAKKNPELTLPLLQRGAQDEDQTIPCRPVKYDERRKKGKR